MPVQVGHVCIVVALLLTGAQSLFGQTAFRILNSNGTQSITTSAGSSFTVKLNIDTDDTFTGYSLFLQDNGFTSTTHFTITGRTNLASNPFTTPNTPDASFAADPITTTTLDLGYSGSAHSFQQNIDLMNVTIAVAPGTPNGSYTLQGTSASFIDASFGHEAFDVRTQYTVTVTPEPAALGIIFPGILFLLRRRR